MRGIVQRVSNAAVAVDGETISSIGHGLLVLVGVVPTDTTHDASALAAKIVTMRIFSDDAGKMNRSLQDIGGSVLIVSQFTLVADLSSGRRPSFVGAAHPDRALGLIQELAAHVEHGGVPVAMGKFGAKMDVTSTNAGPVTFVIDVESGRVS